MGRWGERYRVERDRGGVRHNLITQKPGTLVPIQIPHGYPGTKIPKVQALTTPPSEYYDKNNRFAVSTESTLKLNFGSMAKNMS